MTPSNKLNQSAVYPDSLDNLPVCLGELAFPIHPVLFELSFKHVPVSVGQFAVTVLLLVLDVTLISRVLP